MVTMELQLTFSPEQQAFDVDGLGFKYQDIEASVVSLGNLKAAKIERLEVGTIKNRIAARIYLADGRSATFAMSEKKIWLI